MLSEGKKVIDLSESERAEIVRLITLRRSPISEVSKKFKVSSQEVEKLLKEKGFVDTRQAIVERAKERYEERHKANNKIKETSMASVEKDENKSVAEELEELRIKYDTMAEEYASCKTELEELKKRVKKMPMDTPKDSCSQEPKGCRNKCCDKDTCAEALSSKGTVIITAGNIKVVVVE